MTTAPPQSDHPVRPDAAQAHRARWLAWYRENRHNPYHSARRSQVGRRNAEAGRTQAGALKLWGLE